MTSMADGAEDRRQAATLAVGIAASVTTAALAVLAAASIVITFIVGKYHELGAFYVVIGISTILLVVSIVVGTHGIAEITKNGFSGNWLTKTGKKLFDWQAKITAGGLVVFVVAIVVGLQAPLIPPQSPANTATRYELQTLRQQLKLDEALVERIAERQRTHRQH